MLKIWQRPMTGADREAIRGRVRAKLAEELLYVVLLGTLAAVFWIVVTGVVFLICAAVVHLFTGSLSLAGVARNLVLWVVAVFLVVSVRIILTKVLAPRLVARSLGRRLAREEHVQVLECAGRDWYTLRMDRDEAEGRRNLLVSPADGDAWIILDPVDLDELRHRMSAAMTLVSTDDGYLLLEVRPEGSIVKPTRIRLSADLADDVAVMLAWSGPRHRGKGPDVYVLESDDVPPALRDLLFAESA